MADVCGTKVDGQSFLIEICVTHQVDNSKLHFLRDQKIHSIEIDLRHVRAEIKEDQLLRLLLNDVSNQKTIYDPKIPTIADVNLKATVKNSWLNDLFPVFIIATLFAGIFGLFSSKPKKGRKRN